MMPSCNLPVILKFNAFRHAEPRQPVRRKGRRRSRHAAAEATHTTDRNGMTVSHGREVDAAGQRQSFFDGEVMAVADAA